MAFWHYPYMGKRARELLAETVNRLIADKKTTHRKIVAAGGPANGPLGRLRKAEDDVGIDTLDRLGLALDMAPWQLLHPDAASPALSPKVMGIAVQLQEMLDAGHGNALTQVGSVVAWLTQHPHATLSVLREDQGANNEPSVPPTEVLQLRT